MYKGLSDADRFENISNIPASNNQAHSQITFGKQISLVYQNDCN